MKSMKKVLALVLAAVMALSVAVSAASFPDVDASTAEGKAIVALADMGVLGGFEDGTFGADKTVTRAQFAKIMYALKNDGATDASAYAAAGTFTDVTSDKWFAGYVNWCASQNIVGGVGDGKFDPDSTLTMAQAVKMYAVAQGGAEPTLAYPQGFIDFASEKGYFADVADFQPNDAAPRGVIALIGYNTLGGNQGGEVADGTKNVVVVAVAGNTVTLADADENGRGNVPSATVLQANPTEPPKSVTTTYGIDESSVAEYDLSGAKIQVVDGAFGSDAAPADGSAADIKASDDSTYYAGVAEIADGKLVSLVFYKTGAAKVVEEPYEKLISLPIDYTVYHNPGATTTMNLYYQPQANPADLPFTLTALTQPAKGSVDFSENAAKFWRLRYTQAADSKVGDVDAFTYTLETSDGTVTATGTVVVHIVEPSKVPDKEFTVNVDDIVDFDVEQLYEGIEYTLNAPFKVPSFLIYDEAAGTTVASGTSYDTKAGAIVTRSPGDVFTYEAPSEPCTDEFILWFHDGWDFSPVKVTVNVVG